MPTYTYECSNCQSVFELYFSIKDYQSSPKCTQCESKRTTRQLAKDLLTISGNVKKSDSELKTIGDLANRNRDKMSEDQRANLYQRHNDYKEKESDKELPTGMSRMKKPSKPPRNFLKRLRSPKK